LLIAPNRVKDATKQWKYPDEVSGTQRQDRFEKTLQAADEKTMKAREVTMAKRAKKLTVLL
jgi:hypothetical protein